MKRDVDVLELPLSTSEFRRKTENLSRSPGILRYLHWYAWWSNSCFLGSVNFTNRLPSGHDQSLHTTRVSGLLRRPHNSNLSSGFILIRRTLRKSPICEFGAEDRNSISSEGSSPRRYWRKIYHGFLHGKTKECRGHSSKVIPFLFAHNRLQWEPTGDKSRDMNITWLLSFFVIMETWK